MENTIFWLKYGEEYSDIKPVNAGVRWSVLGSSYLPKREELKL